MELITCSAAQLEAVAKLYSEVVNYLEQTINYPKWSQDYPCRQTVQEAIAQRQQYACVEQGQMLGAMILNEEPNGNYGAGAWSRELRQGQYLVLHTLAVHPMAQKRGVGSYLVDCCREIALQKGYRAIRLDVVPQNLPAIKLYESKGFVCAGERDLQRNIAEVPRFTLYELNLD